MISFDLLTSIWIGTVVSGLMRNLQAVRTFEYWDGEQLSCSLTHIKLLVPCERVLGTHESSLNGTGLSRLKLSGFNFVMAICA